MAKPNLDDYITVAERVESFYKLFPKGSLSAEIVHDDGTRVVMKASAYRTPDDASPGVGHAEEIRGDSFINKTSALENCETSAWGRAIAALGFEVKKGIASREEVEQAIVEEERQKTEPAKANANGWPTEMRKHIKSLDAIDEAKMKLTSMGVESLDALSGDQRDVFQAWMNARADAVTA